MGIDISESVGGAGEEHASRKHAYLVSVLPLLDLTFCLCPLSGTPQRSGSVADLFPRVSGTNFAISASAYLSFDVSLTE